MKINPKKTKVMIFNPRRRGVDFKPHIRLKGSPLEVIDNHKLVGFMLSDSMTWDLNTEYLVNRAYAKMWVLRRIKALGGSKKILKLIYFQHIRSILEFGVAAWNGALTDKQGKKLERVQKVALKLIYGRLKSYKTLLEEAKISNLHKRREKLCLQFAKKAVKNKQFNNWFLQANPGNHAEKPRYYKCISNTKRLHNSAIPYLTDLLNKSNGYD